MRVRYAHKQEQGVFTMIDTLEKTPKFVMLKNSVNAIITGWLPVGEIDIGDFYTFYSYNRIEENRLKFGLRGRDLMRDRLDFKTYLAYGTGDKQTKYLAEASFVLSHHQSKRSMIGGKMREDVVQPGHSTEILPLDHIFASIISTAPLVYTSMVKESEGFFEQQWITGFSTRLAFRHELWKPFGDFVYNTLEGDQFIDTAQSLTMTGFELSARYAFGERKLSAKFGDELRGLYFPKYPVISFSYFHGDKNFGGGFITDKLKLRIEEKLRTRKSGYMMLRLEGGKTLEHFHGSFLKPRFANRSC